jgi:hypothetical protein
MKANTHKDPFIIAIHTLHSCKEEANVMIPSAMLWKAKFNVLLIDLRYNGVSPSGPNQYQTYGHQEHWDVLGAVDYLTTTYPASKKKIGIYAIGMGGSAATIAFSKSDEIRAMWLDAPIIDIPSTISYYIFALGLNAPFLMASLCSAAKSIWSYGCPPFSNDPISSITSISNSSRSVYLISNEKDTISPLFNTERAATLFAEKVTNVSVWKTQQTEYSDCDHHGDSMFIDPTQFHSNIVKYFTAHL